LPSISAPVVPNAPSGVTAVAGASSIQASWTAPAANGAKITGYRATATPGPATCSTTGATSCVLGASYGETYRISVVALSEGGESAASGVSDPVTPTAPAVSSTPPVTNLPLETSGGDISSAAPGQEIVMIGSGYAPYSTVTIAVYSDPMVLASVTADETGSFRQAITVPDGLAVGSHSFVAAGVDKSGKPRALRLDVTVAEQSTSGGGDTSGGTSSGDNPAAAASTGNNSSLPVTGTALVWLIVVGFGVAVAGVGLRSLRRQ
jgi:fibronectin type III domain protein